MPPTRISVTKAGEEASAKRGAEEPTEAAPTSKRAAAGQASVPASRFDGVSWLAAHGKWEASINADGTKTHLGLFDVEEEAARKYDEHARLHGRTCNFAPDGVTPAQKMGKAGSKYAGVSWKGAATKVIRLV
jgi:hypothetical protein